MLKFDNHFFIHPVLSGRSLSIKVGSGFPHRNHIPSSSVKDNSKLIAVPIPWLSFSRFFLNINGRGNNDVEQFKIGCVLVSLKILS